MNLDNGLQPRSSRLWLKLSRVAFGITLFLIPFRYRFVLSARPVESVWSDYTDFLLFASDVFMLATLLCWLFSSAGERRKIEIGPFFLTLPLAGLTVMSFLSILPSLDRALSLYHALRLLLLGGIYLYIVNGVEGLRRVVPPLAAGAAVQAVVGIAQVLDQHSLGLGFLGEYDLNPAWRGVSVVWTEGARSLRAYGLSDHPNILGGSLAFAALLLLAWLLTYQGKWRLPLAGALALSVTGLFLTFSRSAWLAFALGCLLLVLLLARTGGRQALGEILPIGALVILVVLPFLWANLNLLGIRLGRDQAFQEIPGEIASLGERQVLNDAANQVFIENAVLGVGVGTMPLAIQARYPEFPTYYQPAHIALLDVAGETGLFGALFYAVLLIAPWVALGLKRRNSLSIELVGVSAALLALTVVGFFDYYTWLLVPGRLWQWLLWGLWAVAYRASFMEEAGRA